MSSEFVDQNGKAVTGMPQTDPRGRPILQDTDGEASYISKDEFIGPTSSSNFTQQTS